MSKPLRMLGALALATATVPFLAVSPAYAESTSITASSAGYFYAEGIRKPDESPAAPPNVTNTAVDRVAAGNLAVAAQAGMENKVSFLLYDLLEITPGSMITKATLTLPLVPNDANNASYASEPAKVVACMAGPEGFNGDDGNNFQDAPTRKCDAFSAPGKASADGKAYVFDVTKLAAGWVDGDNDGVALTSASGARTTPFQQVFAGPEKAKLDLVYTPSPELDVAPPVTVPEPPSTGTTDGAGFGSVGTFVPPPADTSFGTVSSPVIPEAAPAPAPGLAPAAPATTPAVAAGPATIEMLRPTTQFWVAGLLLAGLLALLGLILGDSRVATTTAKPSRLTRALDGRRRGLALPRLSASPLS